MRSASVVLLSASLGQLNLQRTLKAVLTLVVLSYLGIRQRRLSRRARTFQARDCSAATSNASTVLTSAEGRKSDLIQIVDSLLPSTHTSATHRAPANEASQHHKPPPRHRFERSRRNRRHRRDFRTSQPRNRSRPPHRPRRVRTDQQIPQRPVGRANSGDDGSVH